MITLRYDSQQLIWFLYMNIHPFSMLDHIVFNKFMKVTSPFYKKINWQTIKEDCMTAYMLEKRRLRNILKGANRVSITTDLWKSGQKIQYVVVTGHFCDDPTFPQGVPQSLADRLSNFRQDSLTHFKRNSYNFERT